MCCGPQLDMYSDWNLDIVTINDRDTWKHYSSEPFGWRNSKQLMIISGPTCILLLLKFISTYFSVWRMGKNPSSWSISLANSKSPSDGSWMKEWLEKPGCSVMHVSSGWPWSCSCSTCVHTWGISLQHLLSGAVVMRVHNKHLHLVYLQNEILIKFIYYVSQ